MYRNTTLNATMYEDYHRGCTVLEVNFGNSKLKFDLPYMFGVRLLENEYKVIPAQLDTGHYLYLRNMELEEDNIELMNKIRDYEKRIQKFKEKYEI